MNTWTQVDGWPGLFRSSKDGRVRDYYAPGVLEATFKAYLEQRTVHVGCGGTCTAVGEDVRYVCKQCGATGILPKGVVTPEDTEALHAHPKLVWRLLENLSARVTALESR